MNETPSSQKDKDMAMYLVGGGILLVLLLAFSYSNSYSNNCSSHSLEQEQSKQNDFKSLTETLFTAPVPIAPPMPFVAQQSELVVPSVGGVVIQGGTNNYIRVAGTATTDATRNTVGTTNNQVQIYNAGALTAAFDVDGLYVRALNSSGSINSGGSINANGPITYYNNPLLPIGCILLFYNSTIPAGWALCNGQTVQRTDGGGSIVTPNLVDKFIYGGNSTNLTQQGANSVTLQTSNLPAHNHSAESSSASTVSDPGHSHGVSDPGHTHVQSIAWHGSGGAYSSFGTAGTNSLPYFSTSTQSAGTGISIVGSFSNIGVSTSTTTTIGNTGGGTAFSIMPPYVVLCYIMKY